MWPDKTLCGTIRSETKVCGRGEEVPRWRQRDWAEKKDRRRGWRDPARTPAEATFSGGFRAAAAAVFRGIAQSAGNGEKQVAPHQ